MPTNDWPTFADQPGPTLGSESAEVQDYRRGRRRLRRTLVGAWLAVFLVYVASWFALGTSQPGEVGLLEGLAAVVWLTFPLALVIVLPVCFLAYWSRTRVDCLEQRPEAHEPDRFPPDRTVPAEGPVAYAAAALTMGGIAGTLPWLYLDGGTGAIVRAVVVDLLVVVTVAVVVPRLYRRGLQETPTGLSVRSALEAWSCPWSSVRGFTLEQDRSQVVLRPDLDSDRSVPGIRIVKGTRRTRARARHNLTLMTRWTHDHGLPESAILAAWWHLDGAPPARQPETRRG